MRRQGHIANAKVRAAPLSGIFGLGNLEDVTESRIEGGGRMNDEFDAAEAVEWEQYETELVGAAFDLMTAFEERNG